MELDSGLLPMKWFFHWRTVAVGVKSKMVGKAQILILGGCFPPEAPMHPPPHKKFKKKKWRRIRTAEVAMRGKGYEGESGRDWAGKKQSSAKDLVNRNN